MNHIEYLPLILVTIMAIYKLIVDVLQRFVKSWKRKTNTLNFAILIILTFFISKYYHFGLSDLGFVASSINYISKAIIWGIALGIILFIFMIILVSILPSKNDSPVSDKNKTKWKTFFESWFLNSFSEELFYRGLFITLLIPLAQYQMKLLGLSFSIAVVFPAILYALNNLSLSKRISNPYIASKVISSFVLALVSGSLFLKTNSIIPCYLLHVSYLVTGTGISILFNKATKRLVSKMKEQKIDDDRKRQLGELYPIELFENKDCYLDRFNKEKDYILNLLGEFAPLKVEHIGSTAIKSIKTKPTVDMIIELKEGMTENVLKEILEPLGYIFMIEQTKHIMFVKGYLETGLAEESYHLHFASLDNSYIWDRVYFRDYLNEFTEVAIEYEELKLGLEKLNKWDREGYTDGKAKFVKRITEKAKDYYTAIS